mmetsp:Transcript_88194/g.285478  ORF Transcript_88194/g.285478 Transcript_88194/m.285478 type:complete len:88 (-) Transcript_88194:701-964(-)
MGAPRTWQSKQPAASPWECIGQALLDPPMQPRSPQNTDAMLARLDAVLARRLLQATEPAAQVPDGSSGRRPCFFGTAATGAGFGLAP